MATTQSETRVSSPPPPANPGTGLISRLLHRTKSKRGRKPVVEKSLTPAVPDSQAPEPGRHSPVSERLTPSAQATRRAPPASPTALSQNPAPVPHQQAPSPMLRKKTSIRDRFRGLARGSPTPAPEPTPSPASEKHHRGAYVPKHAAADFSRVGLIPRPLSRQGSVQGQRHSYERPRVILEHAPEPPHHVPIATAQVSTDGEITSSAGPRRQRGGLQTLDEDEPVHGVDRRQREGGVAAAPELPPPLPLPLPFIAVPSPAEIHEQRLGRLPASAWSQSASPPSSLATSVTRIPEHHHDGSDGTRDPEQEEASDYELFLARAEERERAHREHLLRKLSQRQQYDPQPVAEQETRGLLLSSSREPRTSGVNATTLPQPGEQPPGRITTPSWQRGHRKSASWTPSFGVGAGEPEVGYTTMSPHHNDGSLALGYVTQAQQQSTTLARKTSIKQRLGAYIKPARVLPTRYEEAGR